MSVRNTLLLVEDDETLGYILKEYLEMNNFEVIWGKNGHEGYKHFEAYPVDIIILDIMMPGKDGFELLKDIRAVDPEIPALLLTAKSLKIDKLKGFHLGADDYVTKPVDEEELLARIHALLRRSKTGTEDTHTRDKIMFGSFEFYVDQRTLIANGKKTVITDKASRLLQLLIHNKNNLLTRERALKEIWGKNDYFNRRSMDVHISNLRKILKTDPSIQIINVHGKGFIFQLD